MAIDWIDRKDRMPEGRDDRILVFSPVYAEGDAMRYRCMEVQFFKFCSDATHWAELTPPDPAPEVPCISSPSGVEW